MSLKRLFFSLGLLVLLVVPVACTEEESTDLGVELQDPFTFYKGTRDTVQLTACTILDDSLWTAGYEYGIFGNYRNIFFGETKAILYSQIAVSSSTGINLTDGVIIDSVVMTLVVDTVYPSVPDSTPVTMHIIVNQLAEDLRDSVYKVTYSNQSLKERNVCFFDGEVTYYADSIRLRMRENIYDVLRQNCSAEEFLHIVKGFSLKMADNSDKMLTVDFSASETRLTMYYHTENTDSLKYVFIINSETGHSMYFWHDYSGTPIAPLADHTADSVDGGRVLYLEPLGGTRVRINMQQFLNEFTKQHPWAVVHYAELLLPLALPDDSQLPVRILANKRGADGTYSLVTDANFVTNPYTYAGFDGKYHKDGQYYRLRVTRHLQELLRTGRDYGTELYVDARRSSAFWALINGTMTKNPIRIVFVYSEKNTQ